MVGAMKRKSRLERATSAYEGPPCPGNPEHGELYYFEASGLWYCAHIDHAGLPASAEGGPTLSTRSFFRGDEVAW